MMPISYGQPTQITTNPPIRVATLEKIISEAITRQSSAGARTSKEGASISSLSPGSSKLNKKTR